MGVDPGPRIRGSTGRSRNSGNQPSIKPDLPEASGFACKVLQI